MPEIKIYNTDLEQNTILSLDFINEGRNVISEWIEICTKEIKSHKESIIKNELKLEQLKKSLKDIDNAISILNNISNEV